MKTKIEKVLVRGKDVTAIYKSGKAKFYRKKEDLTPYLGDVSPLPKTVVEFMRAYPNRVR